ncbi:MAG: tRNA (cytidine(34)-2'-O)-methyltransferase [Tissierellia bacterium]|nr:tRNA (cytidine(34)-2'-O)-methyltransferase [Tissierellia bacterium]
MIHLVLVEPEIPQNTGNIARSCALSGAKLHLIRPLGFSLEEKQLKRAGLDYWDKLEIEVHDSLEAFLQIYGDHPLYLITTKAKKTVYECHYEEEVFLLFGKETAGLPPQLHERYKEHRLRIPMLEKQGLRSLNLSNAAAVVLYEVWRQRNFT